jgi:hypothetical protein
MAKDDDKYKEGVDFEWVQGNNDENSNFKTRRFFTKAEKDAMKAPKAAAKTKTKAKAKPATNAVRPEGKPAGMPKAKKAAQSTARPEGAAAGMPKAKAKPFILGRFGNQAAVRPEGTAKGLPAGKPFILGRFGSQAAVRPETKAKVKDKPKAKSTGAKATFLLKGKK